MNIFVLLHQLLKHCFLGVLFFEKKYLDLNGKIKFKKIQRLHEKLVYSCERFSYKYTKERFHQNTTCLVLIKRICTFTIVISRHALM